MKGNCRNVSLSLSFSPPPSLRFHLPILRRAPLMQLEHPISSPALTRPENSTMIKDLARGAYDFLQQLFPQHKFYIASVPTSSSPFSVVNILSQDRMLTRLYIDEYSNPTEPRPFSLSIKQLEFRLRFTER